MCLVCGNALLNHAVPKSYDGFVNLHLHTAYSLLDGMSKPEDVIKKVASLKQTSVAVTEHGNVFSAVKIHKLAKKANIKHIYGAEFYVTENRFVQDKTKKYFHLTVLAKDEQGRRNINKLASLGYLEGFYFKPRIDHELLKQYSDGLIVLSGCMASEVQQALAGGKIGDGDIEITDANRENAKAIIKSYREIFGRDYYLEVQAHRDYRQQQLNRAIVDIAIELGIEYVATTDSHFVDEDDHELHGIFIQIGTNRESGETYQDTHIMDADEVTRKLLGSMTNDEAELAVRTSLIIADKCNVDLPLSEPIIPHVDIPEGFADQIDYLKTLINRGWKRRNIGNKKNVPKYRERLHYEFDSITKMGFEGYFLLVESYVNSVKRRGIARGSSGGSLIAYLLGITEIDPIPYGLYFERFIDVGALDLLESGQITRKELKIPDVDSDFGTSDRDKVVEGIVKKYGEDKFAAIGQFGYIWDKSAVKDVGRVLNIPYTVTNQMTQQMGDLTIQYMREAGINSHWFDEYPKLFEYAEKIAGLPKSFGVHPCFTKGHKINTIHGYKNIEDIKTGDYVLTHKNRYKKVVSTSNKESDDLYELKSTGSRSVKVTGNHPYYARRRLSEKYKIYSEAEWIPVNELKKGDMIGIPINDKSILPTFTTLPVESMDFWWIVGRFVGDGWATQIQGREETRVEICCNKSNGELDDILLRYNKLGVQYRISDKRTSFNIISNDKEMYNFFSRFGKYASGKNIPNFVINLPKNYLSSFLSGYFSADGHTHKETGYQQIKTVSLELALGLQQCILKVFRQASSLSVIPAKQEIIEGRTVNSKEKYMLSFKHWETQKSRSFIEEDYWWKPVSSIVKLNDMDTVYNITVLDDSSYTVENVAVHNCGRIISVENIDYYTAIASNDGTIVFQGDMDDTDDLGLVKVDILGLKSLDVIYDTLEMIGKDYDYISPDKLDFTDINILNLFREGKTDGVFQFESIGMKETLRQVYPDGIEDLGVCNALFRPASMKHIEHYAKRKKGLEEFSYLHSDLEVVLKVTKGIMTFQEQLIEIGWIAKMKNPDKIRRATGKKSMDLMTECKAELWAGLGKRGWSKEQLETLWEIMIDFASYSFNKSHAMAYAIIAWQMAKLKHYHPVEFMTALLNSKIGKIEELSHYLSECKRMGIKVNVPNINESQGKFTIKNNEIVFGLLAIRSIGEPTVELIDKLRTLHPEPFDSFNDFYEFNYELNRLTNELCDIAESAVFQKPDTIIEMMPSDAIINLIKAGAFGMDKNEILIQYAEKTYFSLKWIPKKTVPSIKDFEKAGYKISKEDFADKVTRCEIFNKYKYEDYLLKDKERKQKHIQSFFEKYVGDSDYYEFDTMGAYLTVSPFDKYSNSIKDFYSYEDGTDKVLVVGTIIGKEVKKSGRGGQYAKIQILTPHGVVQAKAYSNQYSEYKHMLDKGSTIVALTKRNKDEAIISKLKTFDEWKELIDRKVARKLQDKKKGVS